MSLNKIFRNLRFWEVVCKLMVSSVEENPLKLNFNALMQGVHISLGRDLTILLSYLLWPPWPICVCMRAQSCPTLFDHMDCSWPGSSVRGFPRQEYRSGLLFPSPEDLPDPGIVAASLALAGSLPTEPPGKSLTPIRYLNLGLPPSGTKSFWPGLSLAVK